MSSLRKLDCEEASAIMAYGFYGRLHDHSADEILSYDSEVDAVLVNEIQAHADVVLATDEWDVIDGYVGPR